MSPRTLFVCMVLLWGSATVFSLFDKVDAKARDYREGFKDGYKRGSVKVEKSGET